MLQPPSKNLANNCSAVQVVKKRRHKESSKKSAQKHSKGSKNVDQSHSAIHHRQARARVLVLALTTQILKGHLGRQAGFSLDCVFTIILVLLQNITNKNDIKTKHQRFYRLLDRLSSFEQFAVK